MASPRITVVVSTYNRPDTLAMVLDGFLGQSVLPHEVIVADDGSASPTRTMLDSWIRAHLGLRVRHLWHPDDGFRKTIILNEAVLESTGDYLVFTDGDCVPHPRFVEDHGALAEPGHWVQGRRCFVCEAWVGRFRPGQTSVLGWMLLGRIHGAAKGLRLPVPWVRRDQAQRGIIGCNMAAWREDVVSINGFDEAYTGWGIGEDSDLGTRLYHLGRHRKFVYGRAVTYHLDHPPAPKDHVQASLDRLRRTIASGRPRCEQGLDRHRPH